MLVVGCAFVVCLEFLWWFVLSIRLGVLLVLSVVGVDHLICSVLVSLCCCGVVMIMSSEFDLAICWWGCNIVADT